MHFGDYISEGVEKRDRNAIYRLGPGIMHLLNFYPFLCGQNTCFPTVLVCSLFSGINQTSLFNTLSSSCASRLQLLASVLLLRSSLGPSQYQLIPPHLLAHAPFSIRDSEISREIHQWWSRGH